MRHYTLYVGASDRPHRPEGSQDLVDLLDVGAAGSAARRSAGAAHVWHAAGHAAHAAATASVHLLHDGGADALQLLLLVLKLLLLGHLVGVQPGQGLVDGLLGGGLVLRGDLVLDLVVVEGVLHGVGVVLQAVLGLDALLELLILLSVLLSILGHLLDVLLGQAGLVVGDGDLVLLAGGLLHGRHVEHAVGVDVKGDVDLGHAAGHGWDAGQVELAQLVVVLGAGALALEDLDGHSRLVVGVGGEGLGLLGGHGGVAGDQDG